MQVSIRTKRPSTSTTTGLPTHSNIGSSTSAYGNLTGPSTHGLSSGATRRSFGASSDQQLSTLSFYNDAPQDEVTLDQFERAGVDRLQALKQMESIRIKKSAALNNKNALANDASADPFSPILSKYNLDHPQWDNLSHFVLRLAYCKTEELRRWLITQEVALFKYRFDREQEDVIAKFLALNELKYTALTDAELETEIPPQNEEEAERMPTVYLKDLLRQVPYADPHQTVYFKVPFEDAIDLLRERKVYLQGGFAFVSRTNLSAIIATKFRAKLSQQLGLTLRATSQIKQDVRITPLLSMLGKQYITATYKTSKVEGAVTKEQLPILADRSMPLCMSNLYSALKADNHLKHGGRMQLGLFLKGIGLSLNDALAFWKQSFARRTPPEKFDKEYAYNIRHNYGKEGKRTTYTPYGCIKIIQGTPGPGDHHGCPFRQFEESTLRGKMKIKNFTPAQTEDVMQLVKGQHYQIACQKWYQYTHGNTVGDSVGNHPNAYFDVSETYWREQEALKGEGKPNTAASSTSTSQTGGVYNAIPNNAPSQSSQASTPPALSPATTPATQASTPATTAPASEPTPMEITRSDSPAPQEEKDQEPMDV